MNLDALIPDALIPENLVFNIDNDVSEIEFNIFHNFPEVNTKIDKLSYFITLNDDRVFYCHNSDFDMWSDTGSNIYQPKIELESYTDDNLDIYLSVYSIHLSKKRLTNNSSDKVKLHLILPFDYNNNITLLQVIIKSKNLITTNKLYM